jgi:hypothetical protein
MIWKSLGTCHFSDGNDAMELESKGMRAIVSNGRKIPTVGWRIVPAGLLGTRVPRAILKTPFSFKRP